MLLIKEARRKYFAIFSLLFCHQKKASKFIILKRKSIILFSEFSIRETENDGKRGNNFPITQTQSRGKEWNDNLLNGFQFSGFIFFFTRVRNTMTSCLIKAFISGVQEMTIFACVLFLYACLPPLGASLNSFAVEKWIKIMLISCKTWKNNATTRC